MKTNLPDHARVALWKGEERGEVVRKALEQVIDDLDWSSYRSVLIKPNLVKVGRPYAITHPEALRAVLEMVRQRYTGLLIIAEGCAEEPTGEFFKLQGFDTLAANYRATLLDLNADEFVPVSIFNRHEKPIQVRIARSVIESDCRISLCLPKTHDMVSVTLSIKNMVMGSLVNRCLVRNQGRSAWIELVGRLYHGRGNGWGSDKNAMHQGYALLNINLARLAPTVLPHLSIVDGFVGMEGAGPLIGNPVPWGIALAGSDALAVDCLTSHLMGFELDKIGYLNYCAKLGIGCSELDKIEVTGNASLESVAKVFTPHPQYRRQLRWQHPRADQLIRYKLTGDH